MDAYLLLVCLVTALVPSGQLSKQKQVHSSLDLPTGGVLLNVVSKMGGLCSDALKNVR